MPQPDPAAAAGQRAASDESIEGWERVASGWERRRPFLWDASRGVSERLVELLDPQPGDTVLELAAGPGETGFLAAERIGSTGRLISSDIAPAMVAAAERRASELGLSNVEFLVQDAQTLELPDASVDGVLCRWGYMLVPDLSVALSETARVLRPGGRVALAVWASADVNPWATAVGRVLVERGLQEPPGSRTRPGRSGLPIRSESQPGGGCWPRASRAGGRPAHVAVPSFDEYWETTLDLSERAAVGGRGTRRDTTPVARPRATFAERVEPYVDGGELVFPASEPSHTRAPRLALRGSWRRARSRRARPRSAAVVFSRSRIGFTSTTSSEPAMPDSATSSQREVRLAVGEAAAHRRPDARRDLGVERRPCRARRGRSRGPEILSSDSRTARSIPMRSISLIVKTRTPASRRSLRSPSSSERDADERDPLADRPPAAATRRSRTRRRRRPSAAASGIPCTFPLGLVSGVLMSECASIQSTPPGPCTDGEAAERAERDRVVAAEHERQRAPRTSPRPRARRCARTCRGSRAGSARARRGARSPRRRPSRRCPRRAPRSRGRRGAPRDPRTGSPTGPCRRRGVPGPRSSVAPMIGDLTVSRSSRRT